MIIKNCTICQKEIKEWKNKRHYCSRKCMSIGFKTQLKGQNNPNYRHGPKNCIHCGNTISKNAKTTCIKCVGIDRTGDKNSFYGKKHTEKQKKKWSKNRKGREAYFKGKHHTEASKEKIRNVRKEEWKKLSDSEKQNRIKHLLKETIKQRQIKKTKPEIFVEQILKKHNIKHEMNKYVYKKFFVDFWIDKGKTIIEVFGDYWHYNPVVFKFSNDYQKKQIKKDKLRISYLTKCGHNVIIIWENDIKTKPKEVESSLAFLWSKK